MIRIPLSLRCIFWNAHWDWIHSLSSSLKLRQIIRFFFTNSNVILLLLFHHCANKEMKNTRKRTKFKQKIELKNKRQLSRVTVIARFNWTIVLVPVYENRGRINLLTESMSDSATVGGDMPCSAGSSTWPLHNVPNKQQTS